MRIEFDDDVVRAFCEERAGASYPWNPSMRRSLMARIQSLDAAVDVRDVFALHSLSYAAVDASRGSIRVDEEHRLHVEFLPGPPTIVLVQGLTLEAPTGDRNV